MGKFISKILVSVNKVQNLISEKPAVFIVELINQY